MRIGQMARKLLRTLKRVGHLLVKPLREDNDLENFRLSMPNTQTTTYDGGIGWNNRPPATLVCSDCDGEIYQYRADDSLDCPDCHREFDPEAFPELELVSFTCPKCKHRMDHGRRHPDAVRVPEWATCNNCRYHWELEHWY